MSGKSSPKSSTPSSLTPRSTPPRMTPVRTSPPRGTTPTRLQASRAALSAAPPPANGHLHAHSLSMLGAERYQNQLFTTANAELFKWVIKETVDTNLPYCRIGNKFPWAKSKPDLQLAKYLLLKLFHWHWGYVYVYCLLGGFSNLIFVTLWKYFNLFRRNWI